MDFYLYFDEWNAIRNAVPDNSAAVDCLQRAVVTDAKDDLRPDLKISCDEEAVRAILAAAKICCPKALPRIQLALPRN